MDFNQKKEDILRILNEKKIKCGSCDEKKMTLISGFSMISLQENDKGISIGGNSVACISLACLNCGNIQQYATKILFPNI